MQSHLTRRQFLAGLGAAGLAASSPILRPATYARGRIDVPVIDVHVHLFGVLEKNGCWMSPTQRAHWTYPFLMRLMGIHNAADPDEAYLLRLVEWIRASTVDQVVLQAWDGRIDAKGRVDRARTTSLLVPNDYLFAVVRRYPDLFIPCASVNPYRTDAVDELERCADLGARMVKLHPPTMDVDPNKPCLKAFYAACLRRRVIVMVHTGHEHAAESVGLHNCDPIKLELALEEGCVVIAAHAGMGQFVDPDTFSRSLGVMVRRYPNLYFDNSIMGSSLRWRNLPTILADIGLTERMLHGSDLPFPSNSLVFWPRLAPRMTARLMQEPNLLERDLQLKRGLGVQDEVFIRAARLLGLA